jgi:hypothetical protein
MLSKALEFVGIAKFLKLEVWGRQCYIVDILVKHSG